MNEEKTSIDLDLDALAPKQVQINYKGKTIQVNPLDLVQFSKLYDLSASLEKIKDVTDAKAIIPIYKQIESLVKEAIPELKDDTLNNLQLMAIFKLLTELNTPQDKAIAELNKRGINLTKGEQKGDPKALTS